MGKAYRNRKVYTHRTQPQKRSDQSLLHTGERGLHTGTCTRTKGLDAVQQGGEVMVNELGCLFARRMCLF